jgi:hypothetical protein
VRRVLEALAVVALSLGLAWAVMFTLSMLHLAHHGMMILDAMSRGG